MNPVRYQRIKEIGASAFEAPAGERENIVSKACGDDDELRTEVESLLNTAVDDGFLRDSPVQVDVPDTDDSEISGSIGRIKIDGLLARGGMGEVYSGTDELLKREVAVKVMSSGMRLSSLRRAAFP